MVCGVLSIDGRLHYVASVRSHSTGMLLLSHMRLHVEGVIGHHDGGEAAAVWSAVPHAVE